MGWGWKEVDLTRRSFNTIPEAQHYFFVNLSSNMQADSSIRPLLWTLIFHLVSAQCLLPCTRSLRTINIFSSSYLCCGWCLQPLLWHRFSKTLAHNIESPEFAGSWHKQLQTCWYSLPATIIHVSSSLSTTVSTSLLRVAYTCCNWCKSCYCLASWQWLRLGLYPFTFCFCLLWCNKISTAKPRFSSGTYCHTKCTGCFPCSSCRSTDSTSKTRN
jgi:hypothetical protein